MNDAIPAWAMKTAYSYHGGMCSNADIARLLVKTRDDALREAADAAYGITTFKDDLADSVLLRASNKITSLIDKDTS